MGFFHLVGALGLAASSVAFNVTHKNSYVGRSYYDDYAKVTFNVSDMGQNTYQFKLYQYNVDTGSLTTSITSDLSVMYYNGVNSIIVAVYYSNNYYTLSFLLTGDMLFNQYVFDDGGLVYRVLPQFSSSAYFTFYNIDDATFNYYDYSTQLTDWNYYDASEEYNLHLYPYACHDYLFGFVNMAEKDYDNYPFISLYPMSYRVPYSAGLSLDTDIYFGLPQVSSSSVFQNGYDTGYDDGYREGMTDGYADGYPEGVAEGEEMGYTRGYNDGVNTTSYSFTQLFGAIADTPILIVRNLFDFDLFGVNVLTIVMSLFTAVILFYIFRKLL